MSGTGPSSDDDVANYEATDNGLDFFGQFEDEDMPGLLSAKPAALPLVPMPSPPTPIASPKTMGKQPLSSRYDTCQLPRSANVSIAQPSHYVESPVVVASSAPEQVLPMYELIMAKDKEDDFYVGSVPGSHDHRRKGIEFLSTKPRSKTNPKK